MTAFLLAVLAGVLLVRAHRRAARLDPAALERARRTLAAALIVESLLAFALARSLPDSIATALVWVGAVTGLAGWNAFSHLLAVGTRRRDLVTRIPFLAAAGITLAANGSWLAVGIVGGMAATSFDWKKALTTRRLFLLSWIALGLAVIGFWPFRPPEAFSDALQGGRRALWTFANATRWILATYAGYGAFVLFMAFVRDPSLGVRTVGRRLALSHVLVVLVPLALTGALWAATTVLGVSRDRALVASRALDGEADALESSLQAALAGAGDPAPRLRTLGELWEGRTPGLRVWLRGPAGLRRVRGDSVASEASLAGWLDSLTVLPSSGVIARRDGIYFGAAGREGGREAIALAPVDSVLSRVASRVADARVRLLRPSFRSGAEARAMADSLVHALDSLDRTISTAGAESLRAVSESLEVERVRRITRRFGIPDASVQVSYEPDSARRGARLTAGDESFEADSMGRSFLLDGYSFARGVREDARGWRALQAMVIVSLSPGRVLSGLFVRPREDELALLPLFLLLTLGLLFAVVVVSDVIMVGNMGRGVASVIGELRGSARRLQAGDLTHRIEVRGDDDLWDVAKAMNRATQGLADAREAEKERERLETELALARRIQARLLPEGPPHIAGLDIAGASESAREVGGDYFDHIDLGGGRVALVIADVSGKGVPAALIMSAFRASLVSHDLAQADPASLASRLNDFLHRSVDPGKFVTAFVGFLDATSGELRYVNAGHNPPVLLRADGAPEWLSEGGTILGIMPASSFSSGTVTLLPGDLLALYTDGVTEGANAAGDMWGEERLLAALQRLRNEPADRVVTTLVAEVRAFEGETGPADDITMLVARRIAARRA